MQVRKRTQAHPARLPAQPAPRARTPKQRVDLGGGFGSGNSIAPSRMGRSSLAVFVATWANAWLRAVAALFARLTAR